MDVCMRVPDAACIHKLPQWTKVMHCASAR